MCYARLTHILSNIMEISKVSSTSIKLKGKNASVVIDPSGKVEADVVIASSHKDSLAIDKVEGKRLVISGPGEYEVGGISITGKDTKGGVLYQLLEGVKVLFAPSSALSYVPDDEDFDALIIKLSGEVSKDAFAPINSKCVVLLGDLSLTHMKADEVESVSKINLKKTAEISGKTFLIS